MCHFQFHLGTMAGCKEHTKAIADMVDSKGGLDALDMSGLLKTLVLWYKSLLFHHTANNTVAHGNRNDRASTLYARTDPTYRHTTDQGPVSVEFLSPGFLHCFQNSIFCFPMTALLNEMGSVVASTRMEHGNVILNSCNKTIAASISRNTDFDARLLAFSSSMYALRKMTGTTRLKNI
jgi:hypothetical protein